MWNRRQDGEEDGESERYSTVQHIQYSYSTVQYSTIQYIRVANLV